MSILGPALCNIFINELGDWSECTLIGFSGNLKLRGAADISGGFAAIQKNCERLEK